MLHIKDNHEEYRIDPNRVFAVGFSAGGHLLASLSTMVDNEEIREAFGKDTARLRPAAAVLSYPVTTALEDTHKGSFENLLGKPYDEIPEEELRRQSPELSVNEKTPPMFIWHTAEDDCVPVLGSIKMAKALALGGVPYKLSIYPYGPHALGNALNPPYQYPWIDEACQWINTIV
jgi:acetyl esterase/lipase